MPQPGAFCAAVRTKAAKLSTMEVGNGIGDWVIGIFPIPSHQYPIPNYASSLNGGRLRTRLAPQWFSTQPGI
ncbi:MAG: hypothetical protein KME21_16720 [Desmonostoc vinosum HA7617-LM4]|nr:hypothetical protein [Desmonostoc vinosum HA7617-LM4]